MWRVMMTLLLGLTLSSSSCAPPVPIVVTPEVELPARPAMLPVNWTHVDGLHCLASDDDARALLINLDRKDAHVEILEGVIKAVNGK